MNIIEYVQRPYKSWLPKNLNKKITQIDSIEIDLASHCNLNCKGCTHFSPIAEKWFINVDDFRRDVQRDFFYKRKKYLFNTMLETNLFIPKRCYF